eukprot:TRINITY_DN18111_c0_g1_i1.p1 TRINITY_DN18111_c0_g1~~TRINITY_DN18111_c0_g1_i1.p1  ORF type:complete len:146 (-),score=36.17 TRINITY_DN18111_c0_g1_i1:278-715(-)
MFSGVMIVKTILPLVILLATTFVEAQDLPSGLGEVLQQPSHQHLLEYLRDLAPQDYPDYGMIAKAKRGWWDRFGNKGTKRWGNKYKDNKSYGFWITALNKAGNKRKRGDMGVPVGPIERHLADDYDHYTGHSDYSDLPENLTYET